MMIRWLQNLLLGPVQRHGTARHAQKTAQQPAPHGLVDVVFEAIRDEAQDLNQLVHMGMPVIKRRRRRAKIRKKVSQSIDSTFDDPAMLEEITDKIAHAADVDPYYERLFDDDE
jgi:hypothetical protein